jgi:hypothetical protein
MNRRHLFLSAAKAALLGVFSGLGMTRLGDPVGAARGCSFLVS